MASVDPTTRTAYGATNWESYSQGRPPYPASLTEIIYAYRRQHADAQWNRLVDIGAGSGIASTNFMRDFKTIHNSDPSASNEAQARAFLPAWAAQHGLDPTFEYSQSTGEDAHTKVGENETDLAICATAAHFIDPDGLVSSIGKILRPGGTMAVFSYWLPTFPGSSERLHDAFARMFEDVVLKKRERDSDEATRAHAARAMERRLVGRGALDSVPLPEEVFEDPVRVYINPPVDGAVPYKGVFLKYWPAGPHTDGLDRVRVGERIVGYHTGTDPEADGWAFDVDKMWFVAFLNTFRSSDQKLSPEDPGEELLGWERVFDEECPTGKLRVVWTAYLVLGTRR
ncbi:hypothetical protein BO70DRAFT_361682 [Aspergillus heteromorphus CBS 117.55]|uniref:Methyltransferase type 11 domain-containing protein n=1 Tax=Aspergillus heteromorphus CBS 117.55 TaxID=1448321 RepID=A0A317WAR5_9EURO|nr:uncharacterized protein BO70DRAFT_361682 [Aspergillus heteromorphus CBS 117.55]PWY83584.1 hypothetical protein BO70DRAFT_361682 [Aspergillus heteromorphus CBS 117.55]